MDIIAKTDKGFLLSATENELKSIFSAVSKPITDKNPINIGDKVPAYDYTAVIEKCKEFKESYDFRQFKIYANTLIKTSESYIKSIESLTFDI